MNEHDEEILAILEKNLPEAREKALLAELREDEALQRHLRSHILFWEMMKMSSGRDNDMKPNDTQHLDDETLAAFWEAGVAPDEEAKLKAHLQTCSACFFRMTAMQKALKEREHLRFQPTPADFVAKAKQLLPTPAEAVAEAKGLPILQSSLKGVFEKIKSWLEPIPAWGYGVAGIAVVAVVLLTLLLPKAPVKNFTISKQLVISKAGPLGFVGEQERKEYKGMSVNLSEDGKNLIFTWPKIENVQFYEIHLIQEGEKSMITPLGGTEDTSYVFPKQSVQIKVRYDWELSGRMKDGRGFLAKAGFLLQ